MNMHQNVPASDLAGSAPEPFAYADQHPRPPLFDGLAVVGTAPCGTEIRVLEDDGMPSHYLVRGADGPDVEIYCDIISPISMRAALDHATTGSFTQDPRRVIEIPPVPADSNADVHLGELPTGYGLYALRLPSGEVTYFTHECGLAAPVYSTAMPAALVSAAVDIAEARWSAALAADTDPART